MLWYLNLDIICIPESRITKSNQQHTYSQTSQPATYILTNLTTSNIPIHKPHNQQHTYSQTSQPATYIFTNLTTSNIHIPGHNIEQTPAGSSAGGSLIYLSWNFSYKNRPDLQIYHPKNLASTFTEILLPDKSTCIVGTVYKHPQMGPYSFNTFFKTSSKIKQKTKKVHNTWL